jgi:hypothetical protein
MRRTPTWESTVSSNELSRCGVVFENNSPVVVWSIGPDKMFDPNGSAKVGANKDNVLSWKQ